MSGDLEKRIQALEDEKAIQQTINNYGHFIDYGRNEEWLDLFIDDGVYKITSRGKTIPQVIVPQPEGGLKGKDMLKGYIMGHPNAPDAWHKHCTSATNITLESDTEASAVSYFFRLDEVNNGTANMLSGLGICFSLRQLPGQIRQMR